LPSKPGVKMNRFVESDVNGKMVDSSASQIMFKEVEKGGDKVLLNEQQIYRRSESHHGWLSDVMSFE